MLGISRWSGCLARRTSIVLVAKLSGKVLGYVEARRQGEDDQAFAWRVQRQAVPLMPHHHDLTWECMTVTVDTNANTAWVCWNEDLMYNCPESKSGNCAHESSPYQWACSCPPCPNALWCNTFHTPQMNLEIHGGVCLKCSKVFGKGKALVFTDNQTCIACHKNNTVCIKHPECLRISKHVFCTTCFYEMTSEQGWTVYAKDYGFPHEEEDNYDYYVWEHSDAGLAYKHALALEEETQHTQIHCATCAM